MTYFINSYDYAVVVYASTMIASKTKAAPLPPKETKEG